MGATLSSLYPPPPTFTEANVSELKGRVYIVTGASAGIGLELTRILYGRHARVWIAARSKERAEAAIASIKAAEPDSRGELCFVRVDLADLATVKPAVNEFLAKESRLDVLWNNAGLMSPMWTQTVPKTAQGLEMQLGVNCVGPFLFTKLLTPILTSTAKEADEAGCPGSVRVVWVGSCATEMSPYPKGISMDNINYCKYGILPLARYLVSKSGAYLYCTEYGRRHRGDGIVSIALNPGNLDSELWRELPTALYWFLRRVFLHPSINGAYTELYAGLAPEVGLGSSGAWIIPWGRPHLIKKSMHLATLGEEEGGTGVAAKFWDWSEKQVESFA